MQIRGGEMREGSMYLKHLMQLLSLLGPSAFIHDPRNLFHSKDFVKMTIFFLCLKTQKFIIEIDSLFIMGKSIFPVSLQFTPDSSVSIILMCFKLILNQLLHFVFISVKDPFFPTVPPN